MNYLITATRDFVSFGTKIALSHTPFPAESCLSQPQMILSWWAYLFLLWISITVQLFSRIRRWVALLQPLLDRYQPQCSWDIRRAVCPFLWSLGRTIRLTNVFDTHNMCLVRGSNISKLRVSFRYGDIISIREFDISNLRSVLFDLSTGKKVSIKCALWQHHLSIHFTVWF